MATLVCFSSPPALLLPYWTNIVKKFIKWAIGIPKNPIVFQRRSDRQHMFEASRPKTIEWGVSFWRTRKLMTLK